MAYQNNWFSMNSAACSDLQGWRVALLVTVLTSETKINRLLCCLSELEAFPEKFHSKLGYEKQHILKLEEYVVDKKPMSQS